GHQLRPRTDHRDDPTRQQRPGGHAPGTRPCLVLILRLPHSADPRPSTSGLLSVRSRCLHRRTVTSVGWWTDRIVPRLTDTALSALEVDELRAVACAPLTGRVLEVGFGSGLNLPHLGPDVSALDAVEPSD